jgi:spermidine synthase
MEGWTEIARAETAAGDELLLRARAGLFEIRCNGWDLMSNRAHASEETMARLALAEIPDCRSPRILIGGLGMGFTLRAALDAAPAAARVEVAELLPEIVGWNAGPLAALAQRPLGDARVKIHVGDVADLMASRRGCCDAILLDTDNGPGAIMVARNARLYAQEGLALARAALAPNGVLALWSADRSHAFEALLAASGLQWRVVETLARSSAGAPEHAIYIARDRKAA